MRWPTAQIRNPIFCAALLGRFPLYSLSLFTSSLLALVSFWGIFFRPFLSALSPLLQPFVRRFLLGAGRSAAASLFAWYFHFWQSGQPERIQSALLRVPRHLFALNRLFCCSESKTVETLGVSICVYCPVNPERCCDIRSI